ncbi:hypothetical protein WJX77_008415 [Trebouxia sp. C0004]
MGGTHSVGQADPTIPYPRGEPGANALQCADDEGIESQRVAFAGWNFGLEALLTWLTADLAVNSACEGQLLKHLTQQVVHQTEPSDKARMISEGCLTY